MVQHIDTVDASKFKPSGIHLGVPSHRSSCNTVSIQDKVFQTVAKTGHAAYPVPNALSVPNVANNTAKTSTRDADKFWDPKSTPLNEFHAADSHFYTGCCYIAGFLRNGFFHVRVDPRSDCRPEIDCVTRVDHVSPRKKGCQAIGACVLHFPSFYVCRRLIHLTIKHFYFLALETGFTVRGYLRRWGVFRIHSPYLTTKNCLEKGGKGICYIDFASWIVDAHGVVLANLTE